MTAILDVRPAPASVPTSSDVERITGIAICPLSMGGCPMTEGGNCPDDQTKIDQCPEC